jgi:hypothetical protein
MAKTMRRWQGRPSDASPPPVAIDGTPDGAPEGVVGRAAGTDLGRAPPQTALTIR